MPLIKQRQEEEVDRVEVQQRMMDWTRPELCQLGNGDILPDFSQVGCSSLTHPIHDAADDGASGTCNKDELFTIKIAPNVGQDQSVEVGNALEILQKMKLDKTGKRGKLEFTPGDFFLDSPGFDITSSGIIITGSTSSLPTRLICRCKQPETLFRVEGSQSKIKDVPAHRFEIQGDRLPIGATRVSLPLKQNSFKIGDQIRVVCRLNAEFIKHVGMDQIPKRPDGKDCKNWDPFSITWDRKVIGIARNGDLILDIGITCPIEKKYGGGYVYKYSSDHYISNVSIENLIIECETSGKMKLENGWNLHVCEDHLARAISIQNATDCFVRKVETRKFNFHTWVKPGSKNISVIKCKYLEPSGIIDGSKRYGFLLSGQLCLFQDCHSEEARHAYITDVRTAGPSVFHRCTSTRNLVASETHQKWATGILFDNVSGSIAIQNRLWMGTGHGWSGAYCLVWNCEGSVVIQSPPGAWNYAIGKRDKMIIGKPHFPAHTKKNEIQCSFVWMDVYVARDETDGERRVPDSLFEYQLKRFLKK